MSITIRFRPIKGYPGYAIGETGEVISFKGGEPRFLKPENNGRGYLSLVLCNKGKPSMHTVHSLVAQAFIGDRPQGMVIDHIDGNRFNNHFTNLRYCSHKDNTNNPNTLPNMYHQRCPVIACKDGIETRYASQSEAGRKLGISQESISDAVTGKQRTAGGYTFRRA